MAGKRDVESGAKSVRARARARIAAPSPATTSGRGTHSVFHAFRRRNRITQRPSLHHRRRTKPPPSLIATAAAVATTTSRRKFGRRRPMIKARVTVLVYNYVQSSSIAPLPPPLSRPTRTHTSPLWPPRVVTHTHAPTRDNRAAAAASRDICTVNVRQPLGGTGSQLVTPSSSLLMTASGASIRTATAADDTTAAATTTAAGGWRQPAGQRTSRAVCPRCCNNRRPEEHHNRRCCRTCTLTATTAIICTIGRPLNYRLQPTTRMCCSHC